MIADDELADMQATQELALPTPVELIEDFGRVRDDSGGYTEGWTERDEPYPQCRLGEVTDSEARRYADQLAGRPTLMLTLPAFTPANEGDRFTVLGQRWRVIAVLAPQSWETARRLLVEAS